MVATNIGIIMFVTYVLSRVFILSIIFYAVYGAVCF